PNLAKLPGADRLAFSAIANEALPDQEADLVVLARGNGEAAGCTAAFDASGSDVALLDVSADYRFVSDWVYGLTEEAGAALDHARRVSNPGCYATAAQLALKPLIELLTADPVVFGVSGYSGAGRTPSERNDPQRLKDNLIPYRLAGHLHEREISHHLKRRVTFTPHVAAFFRGISVTVVARLSLALDPAAAADRFRAWYADQPLIEVTEEIPEIVHVCGRPHVRIGGFVQNSEDPRELRFVACIDNLLKGAASQALQNLNRMAGFDELLGLDARSTG
ncbi:MAG: Asd/ArgC dimerization domain-containing protein, partial [Pseudomonadota bacterium]